MQTGSWHFKSSPGYCILRSTGPQSEAFIYIADPTSVTILVGDSSAGTKDGSNSQLVQPKIKCSENTVFVTDTAVGYVKIITQCQALASFLKILHKYTRLFGLHLSSEPKSVVGLLQACEEMVTIMDHLTFHVNAIKTSTGSCKKLKESQMESRWSFDTTYNERSRTQWESMKSLKQVVSRYDTTYEGVTQGKGQGKQGKNHRRQRRRVLKIGIFAFVNVCAKT